MVQVRVPTDVVRWFDDRFPMYGAKQWFIESCFTRLKELAEKGDVETPADFVDMVVRQTV